MCQLFFPFGALYIRVKGNLQMIENIICLEYQQALSQTIQRQNICGKMLSAKFGAFEKRSEVVQS